MCVCVCVCVCARVCVWREGAWTSSKMGYRFTCHVLSKDQRHPPAREDKERRWARGRAGRPPLHFVIEHTWVLAASRAAQVASKSRFEMPMKFAKATSLGNGAAHVRSRQKGQGKKKTI